MRSLLGTVIFIAASLPAVAANWLQIQGTEPATRPAGPRFTGFIQMDYQRDSSDAHPNGTYIPPKVIGPDLNDQSAFTPRRIRLGTRGKNESASFNYFFFTDFGENPVNQANGHPTIMDASISLAIADQQWLRMGLFKTPGAEEGLQAIHVADYINYSSVTNQLIMERLPNAQYTNNIAPLDLNNPDHSLNGFEEPLAAFRDVGIEWFGFNKPDNWEYSYAVMVGNGNGLSFSDNDQDKDLYLYLASEKVTAGKGGRRQGLKLFMWGQQGKRSYDGDNDGHNEHYDRTRAGFGAVWREKPWRISGEYMWGDGMIFMGPDKPTFDINGPASPGGSGLKGIADGSYIEGGWYIPNSNWELDIRYDRYKRLKNDLFETRYETLTLGAQYHFTQRTHVQFNLLENRFKALNFADNEGPNLHLGSMGQRLAISIFTAF